MCLQVKRSRGARAGLAGPDGIKSVFGQMVNKMSLLTQESLFLPHRVWKVKFVGESVDDLGGGFSESIAEMCDELQNGSLPLLIATPNGRDDAGTNRDCFLLNPAARSPLHLTMFRFLGILMGVAVRTQHLAQLVLGVVDLESDRIGKDQRAGRHGVIFAGEDASCLNRSSRRGTTRVVNLTVA